MRLLWDIFQPSNSLFLAFALGFVLLVAGHRRAGKWLMSLSVIAFAAIMVLPLSSYLMVTLETRFPASELPEKVDGIITLGGALNSRSTQRWGRPQMNEHAERLTEAITLSQRYPDAALLISGGHYDPADTLAEAEIARGLLSELGHPLDHTMFEGKSRTTWENGVLSRDLVKPAPGETWVLVTSSFHMPRAVGVFRELGWQVIPYPVDYFTDGSVRWDLDNVGYRLGEFDYVVREWAALVAYHLMGRTPELFPR
ncbi:YdcF family protein [Emcibacter sp. SYSU 3D8]|uniref:YdcF family protein n=1 Tax=Emcibacter sp. SYSU 3D8 TaxID=3133969 RepID=UPI0031FF20EE